MTSSASWRKMAATTAESWLAHQLKHNTNTNKTAGLSNISIIETQIELINDKSKQNKALRSLIFKEKP